MMGRLVDGRKMAGEDRFVIVESVLLYSQKEG
jgi:hypothetical protein